MIIHNLKNVCSKIFLLFTRSKELSYDMSHNIYHTIPNVWIYKGVTTRILVGNNVNRCLPQISNRPVLGSISKFFGKRNIQVKRFIWYPCSYTNVFKMFRCRWSCTKIYWRWISIIFVFITFACAKRYKTLLIILK